MLAGDNPDFQIAFGLIADGQQIDVAALHGTAQIVDAAEAAALRVAQKVQMLLVGIGFEIGVIHAVGQRRMVDGQHAVFVCRRHAEPVLAVVGSARLIIFPALGIGRIRRIFKVHHAILVGRALKPEIEPLRKVRGVVGTQCQPDIVRIGRIFDGNGTCVELCADFNHGFS